MKAKELIEILKQADEDAEVLYGFNEGFPYTIHEATVHPYNGKPNGQVVMT